MSQFLYLMALFTLVYLLPWLFSQLIKTVDPTLLKLTPIDTEIYTDFREQFPDCPVDVVDEETMKSKDGKIVSICLSNWSLKVLPILTWVLRFPLTLIVCFYFIRKVVQKGININLAYFLLQHGTYRCANSTYEFNNT